MSMTSKAVAKPDMMIEGYAQEFAKVLPSHVPTETFVRLAVGAMRRDPKLMQVATQNPASLMHALMESARLGLEPGTEEYHLTPRYGKQPGVVGIVGWQGYVELIYRAGAVSSVIAELVHEKDRFVYRPGDGRPTHEVDWFGDRGAVIGSYAYCIMVDGSVSKVVICGPQEFATAKAASVSAGKGGPWDTHPNAMKLKTAVRQLHKWVPTSAEYRREQLRAVAEVAGHAPATVTATQVAPAPPIIPDDEPMPPPPYVDEDGVIEAESDDYYAEDDPA